MDNNPHSNGNKDNLRNRKKIGEILLENNMITQKQLEQVLNDKKSGQRLGSALIEHGIITEQQLISVLEQQLGILRVNLYDYPFDKMLFGMLSKEFVKRNMVIPLKKENNYLVVAMEDPLDYFVINDLRLTTGFRIKPMIATKDELTRAIMKHYELDSSFSGLLEEASIPSIKEREVEEDSPIIILVNQLLLYAIQQGASDIHIDPHEADVAIRYRVDGLLRTERLLPKHIQHSLISRLKIMANLDITEQRMPQDGRITFQAEGVQVDLRMATLPTVHGERIVLRLLGMIAQFTQLQQIGFQPTILKKYIHLIEKPHGIILITGPTGSGKSSTLYATLRHLNREEVNIITIEDPVEYQLEGINQIQVNTAIGMTFSKGLRAILRQDPNVIMVGEIRDVDTAEIAIRASLTGHFVLSTLHTNDSLGTINRLMDMGIEAFLVASSLNGVVSQRLVRQICRDCKQPYEPSVGEKVIFEKYGIPITELYRGQGCSSCQKTGYKGRIAVHELLIITDSMRQLIINQASFEKLKEEAVRNDMIFLMEDGLQKAKNGLTTIEEIIKITFDT